MRNKSDLERDGATLAEVVVVYLKTTQCQYNLLQANYNCQMACYNYNYIGVVAVASVALHHRLVKSLYYPEEVGVYASNAPRGLLLGQVFVPPPQK